MQKITSNSRNSIFVSFLIPAATIIVIFVFLLYIAAVLSIFKIFILVLGCVGIGFGVVGIRRNKSSHRLIVLITGIVGILLNVTLTYAIWRVDLVTVTGTISSASTSDILINVDLPTNDVFSSVVDATDSRLGVNILKYTVIYQQNGQWDWQRKIVNTELLQTGQHVEVRVFWPFIYITLPPQIDAVQITILDK